MEQATNILEVELLGIRFTLYIYAFACILGGFLARWAVALAGAKLAILTGKTKTSIDDIILKSIIKPLGWTCMIFGVYFATLVLPIPSEPINVRSFIDALARSALITLLIWGLVLLLDGLMDQWTRAAAKSETKLDDQLVPIVRSSGKTFLILMGAVLFLQNMGYSVSSLLAGLGIGGMAIALASKDTIANLFGSIVLFVDRPFHVGDWIEMGDVEGTVEEISLRTTRIRTFANSLITIPNACFTTNAINNWSRMKKRRIKMTIGVTYDTPAEKVEKAVAKIREIIASDDNIRNDFYLVNFDAFGASSLDIFIYCFTVTTNWGDFLQAKQEFMLQVMRAFEEIGVEFAFPTQTLHVASMPGEPEALTKQRPQ